MSELRECDGCLTGRRLMMALNLGGRRLIDWVRAIQGDMTYLKSWRTNDSCEQLERAIKEAGDFYRDKLYPAPALCPDCDKAKAFILAAQEVCQHPYSTHDERLNQRIAELRKAGKAYDAALHPAPAAIPAPKCGRTDCCDGYITSWVKGSGTSSVPCPSCQPPVSPAQEILRCKHGTLLPGQKCIFGCHDSPAQDEKKPAPEAHVCESYIGDGTTGEEWCKCGKKTNHPAPPTPPEYRAHKTKCGRPDCKQFLCQPTPPEGKP